MVEIEDPVYVCRLVSHNDAKGQYMSLVIYEMNTPLE